MNKYNFMYLISLILIVVILILGGWSDTHYSTTAVVYQQVDDNIIMVDAAGYLWEVTNRPDLKLNDVVTISFYNNGTDYTREDDEIIKVAVDK